MDILNEPVLHNQFGSGRITAQTASTITVEFPDGTTKKFLYPAAFETFLELAAPEAKARMDRELEFNRSLANVERRAREAEDEKRLQAERKALLQRRLAAAKKRSAVPKSKPKSTPQE